MNHLKTIHVSDFEMNLSDSGDGVATPGQKTLLLVHGFPLDRRMWHEQIESLSKVARVIVPDLRGFGKSTPGGQTISMERLADDLAALLDGLPVTEPIVMCGLSMGGYVAWQFWLRHAERLSGLILCDTKSAADTAEAAANREKVAQQVLEQGSSVIAEAMLPKLFHEKTAERNSVAVKLMQEVMLNTAPATVAAAQRAMAVRQNVTPRLGEMNLPTLVIVGEKDAISPPAEMQTIADSLPQAEFVVVPEAGHMSPLENPAVFNAAVEKFLARI
jgi:3-oxoadipate enol-lactonase